MHKFSLICTTLACSFLQVYYFVVQTHAPVRLCSTFSTSCTNFLYIPLNNAGFMQNLSKTRMTANNAENNCAAVESRYPVGTGCTTKQKIRPGMLDCAHFSPGTRTHIVYSSACVGPTSYFVVYADVASQAKILQGAGVRAGADQRYFTVLVPVCTTKCLDLRMYNKDAAIVQG